jgi:signal transduction histidine kinase
VAAIERSLHSYAAGLEKEVLTLTLSDSLGSVARGWNQLIEQLAALQTQMQSGQVGSVGADVLARFENAVFRRIVDRLPFGVLCAGPDHCISYANAAVAALLGRPTDGLVGQTLGAAVDNPAVQQAVVGAQARAGAGLAVDHTSGEGEQEVTLRFRILPATGAAQGSDTLITVEDISQLREGQRARDNFLYHVTHELRTPLTNIHAYVETLTQPGFDDEQTRKECYNVLTSETRRLSRLVEDILSISQLEVGTARLEVGEVDLSRLIRQMVQDNLGAADEKGIDLTLALPPKVPKISGDKQRLSVLLNNLIGNAVKYTPASGKIHVSVEIREQRILIVVRDNGIGIGTEDQTHVFDKFYRAADEAVQMVSGTGLGLALAREVARLHGGDILLESERGKGSTFTIELPFSPSDKAEVSLR